MRHFHLSSRIALAACLALSISACDRSPDKSGVPVAAQQAKSDPAAILTSLRELLDSYRKIIVLLDDEKALSANDKAAANEIGRTLFHENLVRREQIELALTTLIKGSASDRFNAIDSILSYIESGEGLFDADRLAFREILSTLEKVAAEDGTLPAIKLHKRITEDLDALAEIERNYEKEIGRIFNRFETRSIELKREKWSDYVAKLRQLYSREKILKDYGIVVPYPAQKTPKQSAEGEEYFGNSLPPKTIVLTFDDGPHRAYTDEIAAILKQYNAPAVFFSIGRNLGSVDTEGKPKLNALANTSRKLNDTGFVIANHSFTHAQLAKQSGDTLMAEIANTDALLKAVTPNRSPLFRFPYGAHNEEGLAALKKLQLKSIMWNIDSLDWADPVPSSIADRVLRTVDKEGRGVILFHDIHERTVKALPLVLERLTAEGYKFAGWDGKGFSVSSTAAAPAKDVIQAGARSGDSWAIAIGIDDYARWPKLQYAVRDAQSVRQTLIEKMGIAADHTFVLKNGEATRNGILALFHDKLAHGQIQKSDRLFVFFAGHGATRKLSSGRDLGYLIPVDSNPNNIATDAISMTEIQDIAESLNAKHVLFVMDACYSGLGLTRGGGSQNFLKDNARRIGRQMLTAGGADQLVADGGPNGHSVFTWTLLQALSGKGDLNGDGFITGTELAAYVAPAVSNISKQTPAFGSLPGSEGGEFVFELQGESEFLNAQTNQLPNDAIALNSKLDEARAKQAAAPVVVKDLQGEARTLEVPKSALTGTARQQAQRANDKGLQLYREKHYAEAEAQFTEALKQRPDFALAANNLGFVFYKQEKYREAARWFENTIKMDPSRAIAYLNLGDAAARAGDTDKAKNAYKTYLELAPNGASAALAKQQLERL
jgi:uncharacterized caspase-like protein/peptidoglycan/xylan/chitin deacetylase (PgdA/CDA1 family)